MKHIYLIISYLLVFEVSNAQICNFCSLEKTKEMLVELNYDYSEQFNLKGEKSLVYTTKDYIKSWNFKYNECYLYKITVLNKNQFKPLIKLINTQYNQKNSYIWEDEDNIVNLVQNNGFYEFNFIPKIRYSTNINN